MALDPLDLEVKFKSGPNGKFIAYCDQCPEVTAEGPNQNAAMNNFWKAFNKWQDGQDDQARKKRHEDEKKKAA